MTSEAPLNHYDWIKSIALLEEEAVIDSVAQMRIDNPGMNLLNVYAQLQNAARNQLEQNAKVSPGIVSAVNAVASLPSGYSGLTVNEAYTTWLSSEANKRKDSLPSSE